MLGCMQAQEFYNPRVRTWKHAWRPQRRNLALPMFVVLLMCGGSANAAAQTVAPSRDPRLSNLADSTAIIRGRFVTVNGSDVTDVRLQTSIGSRVEGRIVFEGSGTADPTGVTVNTLPSDFDRASLVGPSGRATGRRDGTFVLNGLNGPRRLRLV